ncbi:hypothetical protein CRM22_009153 [Opisthorchis felineus]|uniref:MD-2-related lipid-recognition domain-containing protein n=1 Tax=Opisthorchis felineus TaxID=147828 RepID=A0A4S2LFW6_OPIFE|nr:hypothetical protein CRM22_009153 [Opisthorchis felineus]
MHSVNLLSCSIIIYATSLTDAANFRDCGSTSATVRRVTTSPCNGSPCILLKGAPANIRIRFTTRQRTTIGEAVVFGTLAGERISLPWSHGNACGRVTPPCPIVPGEEYTYTYTGVVPTRYPAGVMTVRWELLDARMQPFLCVDFDVQLVDAPQ